MIKLRKMQQKEFPAYCQYFVDDYSNEISQNYGHSIPVAIEKAKKDLQRCFPNGLESDQHTLLCIDTEIKGITTLVGYLWHAINNDEQSTFIYDFYIADEYRSSGYGKQAMEELEKQLMSVGIHQIKLRVAYHNKRAVKLYEKVGFTITGFNMSKNLAREQDA
ncbi:GNAT family N-acetyltransferase [Vibrio lamellibrachiae]|uniref:GNAT family N-acetyltransferase n=1 Tax=Vibrio lamellibrachiae TaxID=2910253 RepID=UPI003D0C0146